MAKKKKAQKEAAPPVDLDTDRAQVAASVAAMEAEAATKGYSSARDMLRTQRIQRLAKRFDARERRNRTEPPARVNPMDQIGAPGQSPRPVNTGSPLLEPTFGDRLLTNPSVVVNPGTVRDENDAIDSTNNIGLSRLDLGVVDDIARAAQGTSTGAEVIANLKRERGQWVWPVPVNTAPIVTGSQIASRNEDPASDETHITRVGKPITVNGKVVGYTGNRRPVRRGEDGSLVDVPVRTADSSVEADETAPYVDADGNELPYAPDARQPRSERLVTGRHGWLQNELGSEAMKRDRQTMASGGPRKTMVYRTPATIPVTRGDQVVGYRIPGSNVAYDSGTGLPMPPEFHAGLSPEELEREPRNAYQLKSNISQQGDTAYLNQYNEDGSLARIIPPDMVRKGKVMTNTSKKRTSRTKKAERAGVVTEATRSGNPDLAAAVIDSYDTLQESMGPQFGDTLSSEGDSIKPYGKNTDASIQLDPVAQGVGMDMQNVDPIPVGYVPAGGGVQRIREALAARGVDLTSSEAALGDTLATDTSALQDKMVRATPLSAPLAREQDKARSTRMSRGTPTDDRVDSRSATEITAGYNEAVSKKRANENARGKLTRQRKRLIESGVDEAHPDVQSIDTQVKELLKAHQGLREDVRSHLSKVGTASVKAGTDISEVKLIKKDQEGNEVPDTTAMDEYVASRRVSTQTPEAAAASATAVDHHFVRALQDRTVRQQVETPAPYTSRDQADVLGAAMNVFLPTRELSLQDSAVSDAGKPSQDSTNKRFADILTGPQPRVRTTKVPLTLTPEERVRLTEIAGQAGGAPSGASDDELFDTAALATARSTGRVMSAPSVPVNNSGLLRKRAAGEPTSAQTAKRTAEARVRQAASDSATPSGRKMTVGTPRVAPPVTSEPRGRQRVQDGALVLAAGPGKTSEWESAMETIHANNAAVAQRFADRKAEKAGAVLAQTQAGTRSNLHQEWIGAGASPAVAAKWSDIGQSVEEAKHRWRQVGGGSISESQIHNAVVNKGAHVPDDVWQQHQQRATERGNERRAAITANNTRVAQMQQVVERARGIRRQRSTGFDFFADDSPTTTDAADVISSGPSMVAGERVRLGLQQQQSTEYPETATTESDTPFSSSDNMSQMIKSSQGQAASAEYRGLADRPRRTPKRPL